MFNKKIKTYLTVLLLGSLGACTKQLDTNLTNPNGVTSANTSGADLFANALQSTCSTIGTDYAFANEWMGYWARTSTYSNSGQNPIEQFQLVNSFGDGLWSTEYHNLYDYNFIVSHSSENSILPGASMVMQALVFQNLVDVFGNIPYTQGANPDASTKPSYDDASTVYKSLIGKIDTAIVSIKASASTADDAADIMFKGDKAKWVRFANTLKLRILMRQVPNGDQAYVKTQLAAITSEGSGFLGVGEDADIQAGYQNVVSQQSPFWNTYGFETDGSPKFGHTYYVANNVMLAFETDTKDLRKGYFFDTTGGKIYGNYLGRADSAGPKLAVPGVGLLQSASQDGVIMEANQSFFLQAEAAQRGLLSGSATALYKTAVEESFRYLAIPDATVAADAYLAANTSDDRVTPGAVGSDPLKAILYQKWVALLGIDGLEAWSEYRRTGYPDRTAPSLDPTVIPANNKLPKRLLYPQSEYNLNGANVATQKQNAGDFNVKLFWGM